MISFGFTFIITELEVSWGASPRRSVSRCIWEIGYKLLAILSTPFILTWSTFKKSYGGSLPPGRNKWTRCRACSRAVLNELSEQPASDTAGTKHEGSGAMPPGTLLTLCLTQSWGCTLINYVLWMKSCLCWSQWQNSHWFMWKEVALFPTRSLAVPCVNLLLDYSGYPNVSAVRAHIMNVSGCFWDCWDSMEALKNGTFEFCYGTLSKSDHGHKMF